MIFRDCPDCEGTKIHKLYFKVSSEYTTENAPCPTCSDSEGNPTGRVCVLSEKLIAKIVAFGEWETTEEEHKILEAELTHRESNRGKGGE